MTNFRKWTLASVCAIAATALAGCSTVIDGEPIASHIEPEFPTSRPPVAAPQLPSTTAAQPAPSPPPTATAAPPAAVEQLPTNEQGYVFLQTKSGKTRCQVNRQTVGCESTFDNAPSVDGTPANGVSVTADGQLHWVLGNLGNIPAVTLDYRTYRAAGWTIAADSAGTRFTNDSTGRGMLIATEGVETF
ncbi:MAG: hypothetical protein WBB07_27765 [Mycobacterium sp.]